MTAASLPAGLPVGYRIHNRYRIDGFLGGGANGLVYEVWDERQRISVALKLLTSQPPGGWWVEAELLTSLRGDYILPILNADDEAGVPFIVTEIMTRGSLENQIVPGIGVSTDRAARWVQQAAIGVARVHDHGLLHTDIKPANLFLDADENVLVGDFGLASAQDGQGRGHAAGSPETLAPEVISNVATSVRSDVYSLGASLYQLLAGDWLVPALRGITNRADTYAFITSHVPVPLGDVAPHVSQGLRQIVMKAIAPDPLERFATASELAAAIGHRTLAARRWQRDSACTGHSMCFTGERDGASSIKVCAIPTGVRDRHEIQSRHVGSRRRINPWPVVPASRLAATLRTKFRDMP